MENVRLIETEGHPLVYADGYTPQASLPCFAMGTTMCSHPILWTNGSRRHLSLQSGMAISMLAALWTTRDRSGHR